MRYWITDGERIMYLNARFWIQIGVDIIVN